MSVERDERLVRSDLLGYLRQGLEITDPQWQAEIAGLGDIEERVRRDYDAYARLNPRGLPWDPPLPQPRDFVMEIRWPKAREYPVLSGGLDRITGAYEWLQELTKNMITHPYRGSIDLAIVHNRVFFERHFLHGGRKGEGGTVHFANKEGISIYRKREFVRRVKHVVPLRFSQAEMVAIGMALGQGKITQEEVADLFY